MGTETASHTILASQVIDFDIQSAHIAGDYMPVYSNQVTRKPLNAKVCKQGSSNADR